MYALHTLNCTNSDTYVLCVDKLVVLCVYILYIMYFQAYTQLYERTDMEVAHMTRCHYSYTQYILDVYVDTDGLSRQTLKAD